MTSLRLRWAPLSVVARWPKPPTLLLALVALGASTFGEQGTPDQAANSPAAATRRLADDVVAGIKRHAPEWERTWGCRIRSTAGLLTTR